MPLESGQRAFLAPLPEALHRDHSRHVLDEERTKMSTSARGLAELKPLREQTRKIKGPGAVPYLMLRLAQAGPAGRPQTGRSPPPTQS